MVNCETNANGSISAKNEQGTKKKSKQKRTTLNFNEYVKRVAGPGPLPMLSIRRSRLDDLGADFAESTRLALSKIVLPTAPKSSCKIDIDDSKLPTEPPFVINISNLPYEFEDEELHAVFDHIVHIDVTRDDSKKSKGYARVELKTKEALVNALNLTEVLLRGRRLRVDLYEAHGSRRGFDSAGGGSYSHDDYHRRFGSGGSGSSDMNWRSGLSSRQAVNSTAPMSAGSIGGSSSSSSSGSWRDSQTRPSSMSNESSSSSSSMHPRNFNKYSFRGQYKDSNNTNSTSAATNTTTDDALNYNWRLNNSSNNFGDSKITNSSSNNVESGSNERPKLKLCPRTKPLNVENVGSTTTTAENSANGNSENSSENLSDRTTSAGSAALTTQPKKNKSSIFGNAKPVDTATKERQIELQMLENRARTAAALTVAVTPTDDSLSSDTTTVSPQPQPVVDSSNASISPKATSNSSNLMNEGDPQQSNKKLYRPPNRRNN